MSDSHVTPVKPAWHAHENPSTASVHVAAFVQGDEAHSSIFDSQVTPVKPE